MEWIGLGSEGYLRLPSMRRADGKSWIKFPADSTPTTTTPPGSSQSLFDLGSTFTITDVLGRLKAASVNLRPAGAGKLRGVATRRYTGLIDSTILDLGNFEPRVRFEVDVDAKGRLRRLHVSQTEADIPVADRTSFSRTTQA
jgi:hypothetical protein